MATVKKATEREIEMAIKNEQEYHRNRRKKYAPRPVMRQCNGCGREFELATYDVKIREREHVYCSRECYANWRRSRSPWIANPVHRICKRDGCNVEFTIRSSAERDKQFCSYSCASIWRIQQQRARGGKLGGYRPKGSKV